MVFGNFRKIKVVSSFLFSQVLYAVVILKDKGTRRIQNPKKNEKETYIPFELITSRDGYKNGHRHIIQFPK